MKSFFLLFLAFLAAGEVFSLSLEEALGDERAAELISRGPLTEVQTRRSRPLLTPNHPFTQSLINSAVDEVNPSYIVENLYLYDKPAGAAPGAWTKAERNALYNGMVAMSALAGLQYYSIGKKGIDILYVTSVVIDGPDTGNPLPDPVFETPPGAFTLYVRQEDGRFGENTYRYDFHARPDALIMIQQNLTDMNSGPIRIIAENNLRTILSVIDAGDRLLIYAVSLIKAPSFPGIKRRIGVSFTNRTTAVVEWFSKQADKAF
jgi:hypothetical protein